MHAFRLCGGRALLLMLWLGLWVGCSSAPKVDWDGRVGSYTYDDAVKELGPPDRFAQTSDGTTVAEWFLKHSPTFSFGFGMGSFGPHGGVGTSQGVTTGGAAQYLRLSFGADGKLSSWGRVSH
jgi:hypothetical protein